MGYLGNIFIGVDQTGNAVAGGNPDCTISGRIGYYANHADKSVQWYWKALQYCVNTTFFPLDGPDHCHYAYHNDCNEEYIEPYGAMVFLLSLITFVSCMVLILPFHLLWLFNIVKPKRQLPYKEYLLKEGICQKV